MVLSVCRKSLSNPIFVFGCLRTKTRVVRFVMPTSCRFCGAPKRCWNQKGTAGISLLLRFVYSWDFTQKGQLVVFAKVAPRHSNLVDTRQLFSSPFFRPKTCHHEICAKINSLRFSTGHFALQSKAKSHPPPPPLPFATMTGHHYRAAIALYLTLLLTGSPSCSHAFLLRPQVVVMPSSHLMVSSSSSSLSSVDVPSSDVVLQGLTANPISPFGKGTVPTSTDKQLLGGKGANLAQMSNMGLAVPPGFTLTTECCAQYCGDWQQQLPPALWIQVQEHLKEVEVAMKCEFGSPENPLLLSVRSGAAIRCVRLSLSCLAHCLFFLSTRVCVCVFHYSCLYFYVSACQE